MPSMNGVPRSVHPQTWRYYKVDCALCGVNLTRDPPRQPRNGLYAQLHGGVDFFHGRDEETEWLSHVRLLGNDPDSNVPFNVTLSERARDNGQQQSSFNADVGTTVVHYTAYHREEGEPYSVPFHEQCYEILRCYIGVPELDKEVLHDACSGLSNDDDCSRRWTRLSITYRSCDELDEESKRPFVMGLEYLAMSPATILELDGYFANLPRLGDSDHGGGGRKVFPVTSYDPFTRLSPEVISMMMSEMSVAAMLRWRRASTLLANFPLTNRFWQRAVVGDMPWIMALADPAAYEARDTIDWEAVYRDLHQAGKVETETEVHGLCNRKRIWLEQCPTIARQYEFVLANKNFGLRALMPQLEEVTVTRYGRLVEPEPVKASLYTPTFLNNAAELKTIEPELVILWTKMGTLAAMDTLKHGSMESDYHGYWEDCRTCEAKGDSETVQIPQDDWVTGFSFFIRETRFKRQEPMHESIEEDSEEWDSEPTRAQDSEEEHSPRPMSDDEDDTMDMGEDFDAEFQQDGYVDEFEDYDAGGYTESEYSLEEEAEEEMMVGRQGSRSYSTSWQDMDRRVVGVEIHLAKGDRIQLGRVTQESRLIHVERDKFVVGLSTVRRTMRGIVTQANLIQAPIFPSNCADFARVEDTRWARHGLDPCQFTWRPRPPPADMCLSGCVEASRGIRDARYAELLVLGETEAEMADMIAVHVTLSPMSLQVDYGHRLPRRIGHGLSDEAETLHIDGRGGERIAAILVTSPDLHGWCMRIVTNRNRQLALGDFDNSTTFPEIQLPPPGPPGDPTPALSGVYWLWLAGMNSYIDASVIGIGCMTWNNHFMSNPPDSGDSSGPDEAGATSNLDWQPRTPHGHHGL